MAERGHDRRGPASVRRSEQTDRASGNDARQYPIAPEPVPEEVVAKAKAAFGRRAESNVAAEGSDGVPESNAAEKHPSPPSDEIAS
jgi:hypothetical protein